MEVSFIEVATALCTGIVSYLGWNIKRYQTKVDDLESRVKTIETIMDLLGNIREDINQVKTDVEVIKSKIK